MEGPHYQRLLDKCQALSVPETEHCIYVSIGEKKLWLLHRGKVQLSYPARFGKNPPSCVENSLGTPDGLHCVAEKYGHDAPSGMTFKGRIATGLKYWECSEEDGNKITSRILWLRGLEPGKNAGPGCDTYHRYIYIHGTNQEENFDQATSHGCVILKNADVIDLFTATAEGTLVWIEN